MFQDLEHEIHLAKVDYYENQSQVPVRRYREPLSNCTGAPSTPTSISRADPATSASRPTHSSSRPSSLRHQRSPLPPRLETVLESNSCDMNKKDTCKINVTKSNIARNLVAAADSQREKLLAMMMTLSLLGGSGIFSETQENLYQGVSNY